MSFDKNSFLDNFLSNIGHKQFIPLNVLVKLGLFGSIHAARTAVEQGLLPSLRISERRLVVPRESVIAFVKTNMCFKG